MAWPLIIFALVNSSDVFLILKASEIINDTWLVVAVYICYNLFYAATAFPLGKISDTKNGLVFLIIGFLLYAVTYLGMSWATNTWQVFIIMAIYGLYAAATEGVAKSLLAKKVTKQNAGSLLGWFSAMQSIALAFASLLAGLLWNYNGKQFVFLIPAIFAMLLAFYFLTQFKKINTNSVN
jgi:MFS family permease